MQFFLHKDELLDYIESTPLLGAAWIKKQKKHTRARTHAGTPCNCVLCRVAYEKARLYLITPKWWINTADLDSSST